LDDLRIENSRSGYLFRTLLEESVPMAFLSFKALPFLLSHYSTTPTLHYPIKAEISGHTSGLHQEGSKAFPLEQHSLLRPWSSCLALQFGEIFVVIQGLRIH